MAEVKFIHIMLAFFVCSALIVHLMTSRGTTSQGIITEASTKSNKYRELDLLLRLEENCGHRGIMQDNDFVELMPGEHAALAQIKQQNPKALIEEKGRLFPKIPYFYPILIKVSRSHSHLS